MKLRSIVKRLHRDESGQSLVFFMLMLMVLLGFAAMVTDAGLAYWHRRLLQNGVDGGALAGSASLPSDPAQALAVARNYANLNGVTDPEIDAVTEAQFQLQVASTYNPNDTIIVSARRSLNFGLRYIVGAGDTDIVATASAIVVAQQPTDLAPFGVSDQTACTVGTECNLKVGVTESNAGNFQLLDYPGSTGGTGVKDNIIYGYDGPMPPPVGTDADGNPIWNWQFDSETGAKVGPARQGLNQLFTYDAAKQCPPAQSDGAVTDCSALYAAPPADGNNYYPETGDGTVCIDDVRCPRVVVVPFIQESYDDLNGKSTITVVKFGCFYLSRTTNGGGLTIFGYFIDYCHNMGGAPMYGAPLSGNPDTQLINSYLWW